MIGQLRTWLAAQAVAFWMRAYSLGLDFSNFAQRRTRAADERFRQALLRWGG